MSVTGLLAEIAEVGRHHGSGGYRRFAFTSDDAVLGEWFAATATGLGGDVTVDRCGNQWAWWGDPDAAVAAGTPGVVTGSHLDSVPDGGPMDGPLGVTAALTAVKALRDNGILDDVTSGRRRPLGVVRFVDEEGARFGLACSGSRLLSGASEPAAVLALRDAAGVSYGEAARAAGITPDHLGRDDETLCRVGHFVELHVEQGRALALPDLDAAIGVASRIRPHGRFRLDLVGRADHAGTTLLADRDDPMLALATVIRAARTAAADHGALATVGKVDVRPNAVNAIPSSVRAWLDLRADTEEQVRATLADIEAAIDQAAVQESWTGATLFPADLARDLAEAVGVALGTGPAPILPTGAGHDAGVLAQAGVPSSMLFVRNPTGVSHAPDEHAEPDDCETGAAALAAVLTRLLGP
ncbi:MAG: allantoate amidohydrolase [Kineosporiaceae bacterium]